MQAALLLVTAVVIGLGLSAWQLRSALTDQRDALGEQAVELLKLSLSGATSAAWALDRRLAREVVSGIATQEGVQSIEIRANLRGGDKELLARAVNPAPIAGSISGWIARNYLTVVAHARTPLYVTQQALPVKVGEMLIEMNPTYAAERFLAQVRSTLAVTMLEAFLVGIALLLLSQWLVTTPLRKAAARISDIRPEAFDESECAIEIPELHRSDELGLLLNHTNDLLERLVESQRELRLLATRDALTGLPTRTLIQESLAKLLASADRQNNQVAVIFVDLDRFKTINDSLGHDVGDRFLQLVAATLLGQVRRQDSVGRLGGDEFLIVMPITNVNDVVIVVRRIIDALDQPHEIDGVDLRIGASLGISIYPDDGDNVDVLMRRADLAMYKAKADATTRWQLFSDDMGQAIDAGVWLENALAGAVLRNELQIYLQPQFDARSMRLAGCEALLRWQHEGEWIAPDRFIPVAESSGLIREIGDWVLAETCRTIDAWSGREIPISINVSGRQLADDGFVERVLKTVRRYEVAPERVRFEITESTLMQNLDQTHEQLTALRDQGFRISIDDFGTGYSSLAYLTRLPVDELKIDRSFVSGAQRSKIVLSTIIAMARALNFEVVAEGVETEAQRDELIGSGCDLLQGYLLGKPMPVVEFHSIFGSDEPAVQTKQSTKLRRVQ